MHRRLVLFGGGSKPPKALKQFVEWAGGPQGKILVVSWASQEPHLGSTQFLNELLEYKVQNTDISLTIPRTTREKAIFLNQLANATGIFFTGGDQSKLLKGLKALSVTRALKQAYNSGMAFAGTSAGMAIVSPICITGDRSYDRGLGLLDHTIVDQHFIKRKRHDRLFGLANKYPDKLCIGVDEDAALAVVGNRFVKAFGQTRPENQIHLIDPKNARPGFMGVTVINDQEQFDLRQKKFISGRFFMPGGWFNWSTVPQIEKVALA
jgi:cyanophycinase